MVIKLNRNSIFSKLFLRILLSNQDIRPCAIPRVPPDDNRITPNTAGGQFGQCKMMQENWKMTETLANGYSSESTQRELSNEYRHDRVLMVFQKSLPPCALDESIVSIGRVNVSIPTSAMHHRATVALS